MPKAARTTRRSSRRLKGLKPEDAGIKKTKTPRKKATESRKTTTTIEVGKEALFFWTMKAWKRMGTTSNGFWKSRVLVTGKDTLPNGNPQYTILLGNDDEGTPIYFETGAERLLPCPLKKPSKWIYDHTFVDTPQFGEVYICRSALPYEFKIDNWKPGDLRYDAFADYPYTGISGTYLSLMENKNPLTADEMKNFLQL